jgi:hypothetical protein
LPFFPYPDVPDDPDESDRREAVPPRGEIPVTVAVDVLLARAPAAAVRVSAVRVYNEGCAFVLSSLRREQKPLIPPSRPRFRVILADGSELIASDGFEETQPGGLIEAWGVPGGGMHLREDVFWLWPRPTIGTLQLIVDWPAHHVPETRAELQSELLNRAAARILRIWHTD